MNKLIRTTIREATSRAYTTKEGEITLGEFRRDYGDSIGIAVCGEFDEEDRFGYDYYYPYLRGSNISTAEDLTVERHAAQESYAGTCDESRIGVTLIFYLQNKIPYIKALNNGELPLRGTTLTLSALAAGGTVLMPVAKSQREQELIKKKMFQRNKLIAAAKRGNEAAIETLTLDDMDTYTAVSRKLKKADVFTLVDTYFMPYGVECDQYSVLGIIDECRTVTNQMTGERVCIMKLDCNHLFFDVCVNLRDLTGEPAPGRRFKGNIWLQGHINYRT